MSLKRSSSVGRLADDEDDYRYKMAIEKLRCDLVGFPYCCNKHYTGYRRPPYYADLDYPYYSRWYDRGLYWPDWPYYGSRRTWYYDDYYRDYARGYEEGLRRYDSGSKIRRAASSTDLTAAAAAGGNAKESPEASAAALDEPAAGASARSPLPPPPPPPPHSLLPPYYDRYYPHYWHHPSYYSYYRQPPYYWRRYLDTRAY